MLKLIKTRGENLATQLQANTNADQAKLSVMPYKLTRGQTRTKRMRFFLHQKINFCYDLKIDNL